jgi:uncharacterized protein DUF4157
MLHSDWSRSSEPGGTTLLVALQQTIGNRGVQLLLQHQGASGDPAPQAIVAALADRSSGRPLDTHLRSELEHGFGTQLGDVRTHDDVTAGRLAAGLGANAFTRGSQIYFAAGMAQFDTDTGRRLLAHEMAHVIQQRSHAEGPTSLVSQPGEAAELSAESSASAVLAQAPSTAFTGSRALLQRQTGTSGGAQPAVQPAAGDLVESFLGSIAEFLGVDPKGLTEPIGTALDVLLGEPLTPEEMQQVLLLRRATPLSLPASEVNAAPERIGEIDREVDDLQAEFKSARGSRRASIKRQVAELLVDKRRLARGLALGTVGKGAAAGTGQITYAGIQVVDGEGRRIALEFAETSANEHAEEIIVGRLRTQLTPDQLRGSRITVVGDQHVCEGRCRPALRAFAEEFGIESVDAQVFVRPRIVGEGAASPRTTLRTATMGMSEGLPVSALPTESIYRRPPSTPAMAMEAELAATTRTEGMILRGAMQIEEMAGLGEDIFGAVVGGFFVGPALLDLPIALILPEEPREADDATKGWLGDPRWSPQRQQEEAWLALSAQIELELVRRGVGRHPSGELASVVRQTKGGRTIYANISIEIMPPVLREPAMPVANQDPWKVHEEMHLIGLYLSTTNLSTKEPLKLSAANEADERKGVPRVISVRVYDPNAIATELLTNAPETV